MPKLIFLVSEDWYFVSHRLNLALQAISKGFEVLVCTRDSGQRDQIEAAGARFVRFEQQRRGMSPIGLLRESWSLSRIYRREKPDIVHHIALRSVVIGELAASIAGLSGRVSAIAGLGFLFTGANRHRLARSVLQCLLPHILSKSETIVQNPDDASMLASLGIARDRINLIAGAGVDTTQFSARPHPNEGRIVMLASRMLWDKGVGEFVEAARSMKKDGTRFVLVGMADQDNPSCIAPKQLRAWESEGVVEWWGHRADMADCLNRAEIVCLPSYREGLPKVLLEAMACEKPCIATNVPGCRDAVAHGDNGLLVPARDSKALGDAIGQLLEDKELSARLGRRGRERAEREFSLQQITNQTFSVYQKVLGRRGKLPTSDNQRNS